MDFVIGIDLGTTYSSVCCCDPQGKLTMIRNKDGEYLTPSAVYFNPDKKELLIGKKAKDLSKSDPRNLVMFVKREIGNNKTEVRWNTRDLKFELYEFWNKVYSPEEISGYILAQIKKDVEAQMGRIINKAVVTVPAYFGSKEKESTKEAGIIAGLEILEIIPEPTAAALSYGAISMEKNEKIFVFDLGGGTFDVTILEIIDDGNGKNIRMIGTDGNHKLGGKDWDERIMGYIAVKFEEKYGLDIFSEESVELDKQFGQLVLDAEKAKMNLSANTETTIEFSYGGQKINEKITRESFENLTSDLIESCGTYCNNVLKDVSLTWNDMNKILIVGSMCNVPSVQNAVKKWSGKNVEFGLVNPKTCVSMGAAIQGHILLGGKNITTTEKQISYDKMGNELNLDEIDKIEKESKKVTAVISNSKNITSSSLGVVAKNRQGEEIVNKIISKNSEYPIEKKQQFGVFADNLLKIDIKVVEGESSNPSQVENLGLLTLPLDGTLKKGDPIEIIFIYDNNGVLKVKAKDIKNDNEINSTIKRKGALTEAEINESKEEVNMLFLG